MPLLVSIHEANRKSVMIYKIDLFISFNFMLFYSTPFVSMLPSALLSSPLLSFANVFVPMDVQGTVLDLLQRKEHCTGKVLRR